MTKEIKITCDVCNLVMTDQYSQSRLFLQDIKLGPCGNVLYGWESYIIEENLYFCGIACLKKWVNK
jgi:hypothetical protein